ncbi:MAG: hypothetical protein EBR53_01880 [Actinobacteria bacterium]|nr:hypothetical protein [Actinomycetota bacterium]
MRTTANVFIAQLFTQNYVKQYLCTKQVGQPKTKEQIGEPAWLREKRLFHSPKTKTPTLDFNELVNAQDFAVSERVQRGVASKAFSQAYHTELEKYAQRFVKQYRKDTKTN